MKKAIHIVIVALLLASLFTSCKQLQKIQKSLADLKKLQFKLDNVKNFNLAGIELKHKKSVNDISIGDGLKLANAFNSNKFPASFVLNVAVINPNEGERGALGLEATITSFEWDLLIDDVRTISGNISNPVKIPGDGNVAILPLTMQLDLFEFFGDKGYERVINLALALGGVEGTPARLKLLGKPTVETKFGPISYPGKLTIVDKEWK